MLFFLVLCQGEKHKLKIVLRLYFTSSILTNTTIEGPSKNEWVKVNIDKYKMIPQEETTLTQHTGKRKKKNGGNRAGRLLWHDIQE